MALFTPSYLCINCERRFYKEETAFYYKRNCICKECTNVFKTFNESATHYAGTNMEFYAPAFIYSQEYRKLFLRFKFYNSTAYGHLLGMMVAEHIKKNPYFEDYSYIIPVPISKIRHTERGFNQSEIMLKYVSEALKKPTIKCLKRIKNSTPQSKFRRYSQRRENVKDSYECHMQFNGENLIIFDDVYTSGGTMYECAKVLKECGAGNVAGIACAHSLGVQYREINDDLY